MSLTSVHSNWWRSAHAESVSSTRVSSGVPFYHKLCYRYSIKLGGYFIAWLNLVAFSIGAALCPTLLIIDFPLESKIKRWTYNFLRNFQFTAMEDIPEKVKYSKVVKGISLLLFSFSLSIYFYLDSMEMAYTTLFIYCFVTALTALYFIIGMKKVIKIQQI